MKRRYTPAHGEHMTATLDAVFFDFGDTLFHSPDGVAVLEAAGIDGETAARLWKEVWLNSKSPAALACGRDLSPAAHRHAWTSLFAPIEAHTPGSTATLYDSILRTDAWIPYPDTREVLSALRARRVRVGVVSNIPVPLEPLFARYGLAEFVDVFVESHERGMTKPDLAMFGAACEALHVEPGCALMVGDSAVADGAAVHAGLPVLLLPDVVTATVRGLGRVLALVDAGR
jgi:HAD superfamily hydrolase (TIGR01549 family)